MARQKRTMRWVLLLAVALAPGLADADFRKIRAAVTKLGGAEALNPYKPIDDTYGKVRALIAEPSDVRAFVRILWNRYDETGEVRYGDWALQYIFMWWLTLPPDDARGEAAELGRKLAQAFSSLHPAHPAGPFWGSIFYGFEGLSEGVLATLHKLPTFVKMLRATQEADPDYFYGAAKLIEAKMYATLPPFPLSFGNVTRAAALLEETRERHHDVFALWHIVRAEVAYQQHGTQAALEALEGVAQICPTNFITAYNYEMGRYLAEQFRQKLRAGTYHKYGWDPLLVSILPLTERDYSFPEHCGDEARLRR